LDHRGSDYCNNGANSNNDFFELHRIYLNAVKFDKIKQQRSTKNKIIASNFLAGGKVIIESLLIKFIGISAHRDI
jgi:hypothetical protein